MTREYNQDTWPQGTRVATPLHGLGTVLEPEMLNNDGREVWSQRWAVKLDRPPSFYAGGIGYYWDKDLTKAGDPALDKFRQVADQTGKSNA